MTDRTEAMDNLIAQDADLIDTNDKDSAVLLPCPFCGKQPWSYDDANHSTAWEVECGNTTCSAQPSVWKTTKVEAIAAWNTRQPTQSDNNFHKLALSESFERVAKVAEERAAFNAGVEAAAKALKADAKLCDCAALEANECACGAWDDYKSITSDRAVEIVRALQEQSK